MNVGSLVPNIVLKTHVYNPDATGDACVRGGGFDWKDVNTRDLFQGKRIVLFALPGAFTPTCSSTHLPGYEAKYNELRDLGVDEVYCLSVNDAFTMFQWGQHEGIKSVKMLPDGNGDFTRAMGMLVKKENLGFGMRSWRYSMCVENGEIKAMFPESGIMDNCPDDPFEVSDINTMLEYLAAEASVRK